MDSSPIVLISLPPLVLEIKSTQTLFIFRVGGFTNLRMIKWDKVFKNEPSKICGRQAGFKQTISLQMF